MMEYCARTYGTPIRISVMIAGNHSMICTRRIARTHISYATRHIWVARKMKRIVCRIVSCCRSTVMVQGGRIVVTADTMMRRWVSCRRSTVMVRRSRIGITA